MSERSWPRHRQLLPTSRRADSLQHGSKKERRETESDTNTSEDSLPGLKNSIHDDDDDGDDDDNNNNNFNKSKSSSSVSADTTVIASETYTADASNPRIVIHHSSQRTATATKTKTTTKATATARTRAESPRQALTSSGGSTEDGSSYCGFGISRSERQDLMLHLRGFCDLTDRPKWEFPEGSRGGAGSMNLSPSPISVDESCCHAGGEGGPADYLSQYSDPFDDSTPHSPASLFAQKPFFRESDLEAFEASRAGIRTHSLSPRVADWSETGSSGRERLGSGSSFGKDLTLSPLQARVAHACLGDVERTAADVEVDSGSGGSDVAEALGGKNGRCVAYGAGLSFGQVGQQNNFQVSDVGVGGQGVREGHVCE